MTKLRNRIVSWKLTFKFLSNSNKIIGYNFFFMAEFTNNTNKNASINSIHFEFYCRYYPWISYKEDLDLHLKSKIVKKLSFEL